MKILFILPCVSSKYYELDYHHGIAQLSSVLKMAGHATELIILSTVDSDSIKNKLKDFKPDILAYSFTSDNAELAKQIMQHTKQFGIFTISGGIHTTMEPLDIISCCDAVCIGEGEDAFRDLAGGKHIEEISNIWYQKDGTVFKNKMRPFIEDLDTLPFSDRTVFDYQKSLDQDHRADFMAGRGCPFHCTYCANDGLRNLAEGRYVRWHSPEYIIEEIKRVISDYTGVESICFQDDTFALKKSWLQEFVSLYKLQIGMPFICNLRIGAVNENIVDLLAKAGCTEVRIGVEQGNEELRRMILRRNMDNREIIKTFEWIKKAGIKVFAYNMVGVPGETKETIEETIRLNQQIEPDKLHVSMFRPYPGTALYDRCIDDSLVTSESTLSYFEPVSTVQLPTISKSDLEYYFRIFRVAVLFPRLRPIASVLAKCKLGKKKTLYDVLYESALHVYFLLRSKLPEWIKRPLFRIIKA